MYLELNVIDGAADEYPPDVRTCGVCFSCIGHKRRQAQISCEAVSKLFDGAVGTCTFLAEHHPGYFCKYTSLWSNFFQMPRPLCREVRSTGGYKCCSELSNQVLQRGSVEVQDNFVFDSKKYNGCSFTLQYTILL